MLTWIIRARMRKVWDALNAGNAEPALRDVAEDAVFTFPGQNSWSGVYCGKAAVARFTQRIIASGMQFEVHDVLVNGPLWNLRVVVVISNSVRGPDGRVQYSNRAVEYYRVRWGKVRTSEVFEDTEKASAWDRTLGYTTAQQASA